MRTGEQAYLDLCNYILENGSQKTDRTGTGTYSIFGYQIRYNLNEGFPLLTTKKVPFRLIASELLWFIKGDTNIRYLLENNNNIWNEWAFKKWVESDEYNGPDMTDFGIKSLEDSQFKKEYQTQMENLDRKSTRLNSSHVASSYAVFCLKKKNLNHTPLAEMKSR